MADPNRNLNPVTRHPLSSNSATASWGSLGWRVFIQKDVPQLCVHIPGFLLQETLEGEVFQMFQSVQCSSWMPLILYKEVKVITEGNPSKVELAPDQALPPLEPFLGNTSCPHLHVQGSGT